MEKLTLYIQNMVCDRCEMVIETALTALGLEVTHVQLGRADVIRNDEKPTLNEIEKELKRFNFGLIKDAETETTEKVKVALIELLDSGKLEHEDISLSEYLAKKLAKNYASVSRVFSKKEELTIEKYFIRLKIEKAKELVEYNKLSFSEIAYKLGYKNLQHLSRQFQQQTGMSMSKYQKLQNPERKSLDKI
ncbi:MAG: AraC family transcriptional regulator [Balneolaceae bacterium]